MVNSFKLIMLKKLTLLISLYTLPFWVAAAEVIVAPRLDKSLNNTEVVAKLVKQLEVIKTLNAQFNQVMPLKGGHSQGQQGYLSVKRPDRFVWHTEQPFSQTVYAYKGKLWSVDHDLMQVIIENQGQETENTPVMLLSGNAQEFLKNYYVKLNQSGTEENFILRPSDGNGLFESLTIHFLNNQLSGFTLVDASGSQQRIDLQNIKINQPIDESVFQPTYPKDYDVMDNSRAVQGIG